MLPNVTTTADARYTRIDLSQWSGLLGPAGMPPNALARPTTQFLKMLDDLDVRPKLAGAALASVVGTLGEFARRMRDAGVVWVFIAQEAGLRAE